MFCAIACTVGIHAVEGFAVHRASCNVPYRGFWRWALSTHIGSHVLQGWAIDPNEIEICTRGDGSLHSLGAGAYAKVLKAMRGGVQPVAVKVFPLVGPHAAQCQEDFAREVRWSTCAVVSLAQPNVLYRIR